MKRDGGRCAARVAAICAAILCVALLATGVSHAENKVPLKIGARSTSAGPKAMIERYQPLVDYIAAKTGRTVEFRPFATNPEIVEKLGSGDIDAVILGSSGAARAIRDQGAVPVARPEKQGVSGYRGVIVVRKNSGMRKIEDLKGKRFDYAEKGTSAGYIYPRSLLAGKKLNPDAFFGSAAIAGKHDIAVMKVLNGESDGASVKDQDLERLSSEDPRVRNEILILGKSGLYPDGTMLFRKDTPASLVKSVRQVLLGIEKDPAGKAVLAAVGADRYIPTGKKDFEELIKAMSLIKE